MLDRNKLYVYFQTHHGPITQIEDENFCRCPICGRNKFLISFRYLTGKCLNGCFNGFLVDSIKIYHGISYAETKELVDCIVPSSTVPLSIIKEDRSRIKLPKDYKTILDGVNNPAREYLKDLGLDLDYLDRIGMGWYNGGRVIIPLRCRGVLVSYIINDPNGDKKIIGPQKSRGTEYLFNEEALWLENHIYITNNWLDAAIMGREGTATKRNILGTIQRNNIIESQVSEVCIIPSDYVSSLLMARTLMKYKKVKVLNLHWFEKSGIGTDPLGIGRDNILKLEQETQYLTDAFLFNQLKIFSDKRIDISKNILSL